MQPHSIAVIGVGKIAQDQHLPVIAKSPSFRLAALVSQRGWSEPGVPTFRTPAELYAAMPEVGIMAICTPPSARYDFAREALEAGKDVLLEKPPFPTTLELHDIADRAAAADRVIFTTWHSQYNAAVEETRTRLAGRQLKRLAITWKEDVRRWHPGQAWIWEQGGFGVFDPGINALSILSRIAPAPVFVRTAELTYPANRTMPIAAQLTFSSPALAGGGAMSADFDWRQQGEQSWDIGIETAAGEVLELTKGGSRLVVDGALTIEETPEEYEAIYARFAELLASRTSLVDPRPFQLVADAFMLGRRTTTDPFDD